MQRVFLIISSVLLISGLAIGNTMMLKQQPTLFENALVGSESGSFSGGGNGVPPLDSAMVVCTDIDYGGDAGAPTNYPQQRHTCWNPVTETFYVAWEWGDSRDNAVTVSNWETFGPIGYWTYAEVMNSGEAVDAGRVGLEMLPDGTPVGIWHQTNDGSDYEIYFGTQVDGWTSLSINDGDPSLFPDMVVTSEGLILAAFDWGDIQGPTYPFYASISDDNGATWSDEVPITENGVANNWNMVALAADPTNGDVWATFTDTTSLAGGPADPYNDLVAVRWDSATETWQDPELVLEGYYAANPVFNSVVVDTDHEVHIVFQFNTVEVGTDGIMAYNFTGSAGIIAYVYGHEGDWSDYTPITGTASTDTVSGPPNLGIDAANNLYCAFTQIDSADGSYIFNTADTYLCTKASGDAEWSERIDCSHLGAISPADSFHTFFTHITQNVPSGEGEGPGVFWSQMINAELPASVHFNMVIEADVQGGAPAAGEPFVLRQNSPNPFNPVTSIGYSLNTASGVKLSIYDTAGRLVNNLVNETQEAGSHSVVWNGVNESGSKVASGVYFYRLTTDNNTETRKMVMVK